MNKTQATKRRKKTLTERLQQQLIHSSVSVIELNLPGSLDELGVFEDSQYHFVMYLPTERFTTSAYVEYGLIRNEAHKK